MAANASPRLHYSWIIAGLTFVTLLVAAAIRATAGVLIVPFEQEFGWSRAVISFAVSINLLLYGLLGPFAAMLIDRLGLRRVMVGAMGVLAIGVAATTLMQAVWQMVLLWGIVVGCGSGIISIVLGTMVVERWFVERRGLVLGVLTASIATGQLLFLPFLAAIVSRFGWRSAALTIAGTALLLIPLIALLMRDRPADMNLRAFGDTRETVEVAPATVKTVGATLNSLRQGLRSRDFWLLSASFFVCGASTNGLIGTHLIPACIDHGIPEVQGASLLAFMGIFDLIGTTGSGWLTDRWNSRYLLFWYYGLRGLALLYLPFAFHDQLHGLPLFAVFYGLDWI
ncbi:MAG: MFS transporter, partial [Microcoleus sp. SIO2G3]|nr:MFS transporter [Microcoleus sp. SIO2G3]